MMNFKKLALFTIILVTSVSQAEISGIGSAISNASGSQTSGNTGVTAPAVREMDMFDKSKLDKLSFNFGNAQAWIKPQGGWSIKGSVTHKRIRCATYQMGIRFGVGEEGCNNVTWVSDFEYGTNVKQCNSTTLEHKGGGFIDISADDINKVTCAELNVRCFGSTCSK